MLEAIATGKTIEEATENACKELNLTEDQVSIEILEMPIRKFFKSIPAKVKATAVEIDENPKLKEHEIDSIPAADDNKISLNSSPPKPTIDELETIQGEKIDLDEYPRFKRASDYLYAIFSELSIENLDVETRLEEDAIYFSVTGDNIPEKIVIDGDVMHAFSYLLERIVNNREISRENFLYVRLDIDGYRSRRQKELLELAEQFSNKVLETKRSFTFPPMNSYERLIIHTYIGDIKGLKSESKGHDNERRVVIRSTAPDATEGADWKPPYDKNRFKKRRKYSSYSKKKNSRTNYKNNQAPSNNLNESQMKNTMEQKNNDLDDDVPLYGKIEL